MFTGLVADIGQVRAIERGARSAVLQVATSLPAAEFELGESIAVNGACLTVTSRSAGVFCADVSSETLARTALGQLGPGARVHLERALRVGDRLGGHFVQGHVDGVGRIERIDRDDTAWQVTVALDDGLLSEIVPKGSIAIDGVSLTVNDVLPSGIRLTIVPFTADSTLLTAGPVGRGVNVETDVLGKYVRGTLQGRVARPADATWNLLQRFGYT